MRRLVVVILALFLASSLPQAAVGAGLPCNPQERSWSAREAKQATRCLEGEISGVPGGWQEVKRVVGCESHWGSQDSGRYAGQFQTMKVEHRNWSIPGAPSWLRQAFRDHPNWRNPRNRTHPWRSAAVTLSHVAGPDGWSYLGECG